MLSASDIVDAAPLPAEVQSWVRPSHPPQEPTINQRFGIVIHQVLERFHTGGLSSARGVDGSVRTTARAAPGSATRTMISSSTNEPCSCSSAISSSHSRARGGAGLVRAQLRLSSSARTSCVGVSIPSIASRTAVWELIDYKTGKAKTTKQLKEDIQLSIYPDGSARARRGAGDRRAELLLRARQREGPGRVPTRNWSECAGP